MNFDDDMTKIIQELRIRLDRPVALVGMPACGKSHVGKILARDLDIPLYDIDFEIEREEGRKIVDIFAVEGEAYFRAKEHEIIRRHLERHEICVLSLGGGALTTPQTLELIKAHAISVWLDTDIDTLYERTQRNRNRPLLNCDNPRQKLEDLMAARGALYAQADLKIDSSGHDPVPVTHALQKALYARYEIA